ncbi:hypothetical protein KAF25_002391 [Fusarium avenaceum]|uniref:Heterokaryon incompatibility domain-containing protein n=1 Tax=Fusarium avenaceum TaxID=40199 RepID=A0A9P7H7R9_9HYPO|nr:hypothetical protein KAF25_002391 [Fusarium avenaceum]
MSVPVEGEPGRCLPNIEASKKIYEPLDTQRQEIRLLTLHPSSDGDEGIRCTLSHLALNPSSPSGIPAYEALSYVWGEPDFTECITLNDRPFFITPSLRYILASLRLETRTRLLWADAICINQLDVKERNTQVAAMRQIYSNCARDIAWLDPMIGKEYKSSEIYGNPKLHKRERRMKRGMDLMCDITQKNPQTLKAIQDKYREGQFALDTMAQTSLRSLFERPTLWKRLWVMQELSLAPRVTLMCKGAELQWDQLTALFRDEPYFDAFHMHTISHMIPYYAEFTDVFVPIKLIEDQRRLLSQVSKLMDVLVRFRATKSTNPKDKIYGLLGIVTEDHGIQVDYSKSIRDLYKQTTVSLINMSGNLDILCQNPFERKGEPSALQQDPGTPAMPSWVAEFDAKREDCVPLIFAQRNIFNASAKRCERPCRLLGSGEDILVLKGTILGTVGQIHKKTTQDETKPQETMRLYLDDKALSHPQDHLYRTKFGDKSISTGETSIRAFWRTLVKDCTLPPRMRRLRPAEIETLDIHNQEALAKEEEQVQTYQLHLGGLFSRSAFSYDPGDDFDYSNVDSKTVIVPARMIHETHDLMFATTDNGLYLLARPHVRQGDVVVVLDGGRLPMVLRKAEHEGLEDTFKVVCSLYVHGFMDGEADAGVDEGWLKKQDILLV